MSKSVILHKLNLYKAYSNRIVEHHNIIRLSSLTMENLIRTALTVDNENIKIDANKIISLSVIRLLALFARW